MSNDKSKKPSIEEKLLENAKEKYENESEETKEILKEKGITIEKAIELYPLPHFLDFHYIANEYDKDEVLNEEGEYYDDLKQASKDNYRYLEEAYNDLTTEEKILFRKYFTLSYLADIYDDITDYEDALQVITINIEDKLKSLRPVYNYSEEQVKTYFTSEGFNPNKSEILEDRKSFNSSNLEQLTKRINNEIIDHSKPYSFNDINDKLKEDEGLELKYLLFCEEYLKTGRLTDTCKYLGIGRATAYRWLEIEEVKAYLEKRRKELETEAKQRYNDLYNKCFTTIEEALDRGDRQVSLKAVDIFLKHYDNVKRLEAPTISED